MGLRRPQSYRSKHPRNWKGNRVSCRDDTRKIVLGKTDATTRNYPDNEIVSSKYTLWTFLPKNLYEQFRRIANFYFLIMAIIAFAIQSPVSPLTSLLPLLFVVLVTAVKQAYEDFLRHRADREVNNLEFTVIRKGKKQLLPAKKIQVGDIVRVSDEQDIPCDIVLLISSHKESKCFVTTANLDGETNLKTLFCPKTLKRTATAEELGSLNATIDCESPTTDLYKFRGRLEYGRKTSHLLRQSLVKREKTIQRMSVLMCCHDDCQNCNVKQILANIGGSEDVSTQLPDCACQCRTKEMANVDEDEAAQTLRHFANTVRGLEEKIAKETGRRSSSLSTASGASGMSDEPLSKINSLPEIGQSTVRKPLVNPAQSALKKTHKKTASNVSRVSFNLESSQQEKRRPSGAKNWTLERKSTILSRRNSSLLSTKRPSLVAPDGAIVDPLAAENLLLRGARLKNTNFVYGCAVYTGQDTKLALNSKLTNSKFSTVERSVNKFLIFYLVFLVVEVIISTVLKSLRESEIGLHSVPEKRFKTRLLGEDDKVTFMNIVEDFFSFVVLYNYVIPISLYVTMEMQKFLGTLFFEWDLNMYDSITDERAICNTSDLNEDLGQIEYLFTDKTGTLTENNMKFRRCSISGATYLEVSGGLYPVKNNSDHVEPGELAVDLRTCDEDMEKFLLALSLCHTVQVEEKPDDEGDDEEIKYSAASPDEKALVEAMQSLEIVYLNDEDDLVVLRIFGIEKIYKRLDVLEFTSDRKRMSVIIKAEDGSMFLYCKGAESAVLPLVSEGPADVTLEHVADFASRGLRTLAVAYKPITEEEYERMAIQISKARETLSSNRDSVVAETYEEIEAGLTILGATGVEDQLQDGVQETLDSLRDAGVKVWILTGDKVETAENISMSCGHFKPGTTRLKLVEASSSEKNGETLRKFRDRIFSEPEKSFGLIVDGESLRVALVNHKELFRDVCLMVFSVICCRMSPLQKSEVVNLVKASEKSPVTAAVGDGANDVSMIQEAHVGLGIMGKEGRQAVRCADFAFSRFKFLREALLVHGHWYYLRVSTLVQYFFYKNIVFILPQFYFLFYNGYSTEPLYDSMYLTCYNIFFTSLPILAYGLLEQNFTADKLRLQPGLYGVHAGNCLMTWRHFFKWFFLGVWHSIVIFFIPLFWYTSNPNIMPKGRDSYLELFGTQIFHSSVVVVNLKLWLHSRYWCGPFIGTLALSIGLWIAMASLYAIVNILETSLTYYTFLHLVASPNMWLVSLLIATICLIPDIVIELVNNHNLNVPKSSPLSLITIMQTKASKVYNTRI